MPNQSTGAIPPTTSRPRSRAVSTTWTGLGEALPKLVADPERDPADFYDLIEEVIAGVDGGAINPHDGLHRILAITGAFPDAGLLGSTTAGCPTRDLAIRPAVEVGYGYAVSLPRADWEELADSATHSAVFEHHGDYVRESLETFPAEDHADPLTLHMDAWEASHVLEAIAELDLHPEGTRPAEPLPAEAVTHVRDLAAAQPRDRVAALLAEAAGWTHEHQAIETVDDAIVQRFRLHRGNLYALEEHLVGEDVGDPERLIVSLLRIPFAATEPAELIWQGRWPSDDTEHRTEAQAVQERILPDLPGFLADLPPDVDRCREEE